MILKPTDIQAHSSEFGAKALNLQKLKELGLAVPDFVAVPSSTVTALWQQHELGKSDLLDKLAAEAVSLLPADKYVVRSSALTEDTRNSALAGQFMTIINLEREELPKALLRLITDAHRKLKGNLSLFSIVIQQYIAADFAGITFTRNPQGSRDMVIEYHRGIGEEVVGGQIRPERLEFYWSEQPDLSGLPNMAKAVENFKNIEWHFNWPQDIEWCIKDGRVYYLQTRPVTTLAPSRYKELLYTDSVLPETGQYLLEKTEISEIAPRPTPFTLSLLRRIYDEHGPVRAAYRKYGISYRPTDFLKIVGNELYVDREQEIQTLLPSYSYLKGNSYQPSFARFSGIFATIKNIFKISSLPLPYEQLYGQIKERLHAEWSAPENIATGIDSFLKDYALIFEINLLAESAVKQLEFACRSDGLNASILLAEPVGAKFEDIVLDSGSGMQGNSLEISDTSPFTKRLYSMLGIPATFNSLPEWRQNRLRPLIMRAQQFSRLREYGRWLTVKLISRLRGDLQKMARGLNFNNPEHIYFYGSEELASGNLQEAAAAERKAEYDKYSQFQLPSVLASSASKLLHNEKPLGVSPGTAEGALATEDSIVPGEKPILYTKMLSPSLVQHFPNIGGIISERGGILSHLAIMAREQHIPVIVNFSLGKNGIRIGDKVFMDASTGLVSKK